MKRSKRSPTSGSASWSASTGVIPTGAAALGRPLEEVDEWQVAGRDRLEQPFLAEGPGPEPLHVRHVRMEQETEVGSVVHGRQTAIRSRARSSGPPRRTKSRSSIAGMNQP